MKEKHTLKSMVTHLLALVAMAATSTAIAAGPALQGQTVLRPLTPQELKDYSLAGKQLASGLNTIGKGQPAYLEALINAAVPDADILSVTWVLTNKPFLSTAMLAASPLGANVPPYKIVDRMEFKVAGPNGRSMLVPDKTGQYTVYCSIVTGNSGTTNFLIDITAAEYMGAATCALCHSGGIIASNIYTPWSLTPHAHAFEDAINGVSTDHFSKNCISCHVVGYNTNALASNGGFDDHWATNGWVFPTNFNEGNFAAMPADLRNLSNVQCENCHGPGSEHAMNLGNSSFISKTFASGDCAQCHDSLSHHYKTAEWNNSRHASGVEESAADCSRCHTAQGFANFVAGKPAVNVPYEVVTCAACHDPHMADNPHQLRTVADVTLMDKKTVVTEGGAGKVCMQCHISRRDATNYVETASANNRFGPHHGPQTDMLTGANAVNYGKDIPSSAHRDVVEDSCVTCHMQENEGTGSFTHAGGHTFSMKWDSGTNLFELTEACVQCHGEVEGFDFKRQDYDGNGLVEGVQTEVKGLLDKLAMMLPPYGSPVIPTDTPTISKYTRPELRALYNYLFVEEDGSLGVHNLSYAVGVLKASIADLSGDSNNDGLADWWQKNYFNGNANDPMAAPNASPAGDGIPNWLKYALGLDPKIPGIKVPDGVVWANGNSIGGGTNTIHIYTSAEIAFDTVVGKKYQIQAVSMLGAGWQNVGAPIEGINGSISYLTPTRDNVQQYYRVMITP